MNHPKVTTIAEAFRLAAKVAGDLETKPILISKDWIDEATTDPAKAIAYTHADNIVSELEALAEEYENE